jgi:hypothetical protein
MENAKTGKGCILATYNYNYNYNYPQQVGSYDRLLAMAAVKLKECAVDEVGRHNAVLPVEGYEKLLITSLFIGQ